MLNNPAVVDRISGAIGNLARPYALYDAKDAYQKPAVIYDTEEITAAAIRKIYFFRRTEGQAGSDIFTTNNQRANNIKSSEAIVFQRLSLAIITDNPKPFDEATFYSDILEPLQRSILKIRVDDTEFTEIPAFMLFRLVPYISNNTDSAFAGFGYDLFCPLMLRPEVQWECLLEIPGDGIARPEAFTKIYLKALFEGVQVNPTAKPTAG